MSWLGFRIRHADRDGENDRARMERIVQSIETQVRSIDAERNGLRERYRRATASAAFSMQAMEDGEAWLGSRVDALTETTARCAARLNFLKKQEDFLRELRGEVLSFTADNRLRAGEESNDFNRLDEALSPPRE